MVPPRIETYLETGAKRTFAGAVEWPGWCRTARDADAALETLCAYGARYARVLRGTRLGFEAPADASAFAVVERLKGDATTDFGAPSIAPRADGRRITDAELQSLRTILRACWRSFDASVEAARGAVLATGPRGGGRDLGTIVDHVVDADGGYLRRLAWKVEPGPRSGRARPDARGGAGSARARRAGGRPGHRPQGRQAMAATLLRPPRGVARPRSRLGDRRSRHRSRSRYGEAVTMLTHGDPAPPFALLDQHGETVRLEDYRGKKLLVYFYPEADTPGCTVQSCDLRDHRRDLAGIGTDVVGISPDLPDKQLAFDVKFHLGFPLLSDPDHATADAWGAWGEKVRDGRTSVGLIRSSFLVDEEGRIAGAWSPVTPEETVPNALAALS